MARRRIISKNEVDEQIREVEESKKRMMVRKMRADLGNKTTSVTKRAIVVGIIIAVIILCAIAKPFVEVAVNQGAGYSTEKALDWIK